MSRSEVASPVATDEAQGAEDGPPSAGGVHVVLRYRVPHPARGFADRIRAIAAGPAGPDGADGVPRALAVTVLQPLLGVEPDVWEVRLEFGSMAHFGAVVDGSADWLVNLQDPAGHLGRSAEGAFDGVELLDVATPVWRVLPNTPARAAKETTG